MFGLLSISRVNSGINHRYIAALKYEPQFKKVKRVIITLFEEKVNEIPTVPQNACTL